MGRLQNDEDPFAGLHLDDDFVREAPIVEPSAEERAARLRRDALRRYIDEGSREEAQATRRADRAKWRSRMPALLGIVAVVSLVAWQMVVGPEGGPLSSSDRILYDGDVIEHPPAGVEAAASPLSSPAPLAMVSNQYAFMDTQPGSEEPVAYDPCRPIHVVANNRYAPAGSGVILREALNEVQTATGLTFIVDEPTTEAPVAKRRPHQPDRYPGRWAPVLVAWSDPTESPSLSGSIAGTGGSFPIPVDDKEVYVTGTVLLDGPQLAERLARGDGRDAVRAVIMHELGHLVGLDHIDDPSQMMNASGTRGLRSFGAGDLTGLAALGQGDCFPSV